MKPCAAHWAAMRKKVQDIGLWHLVSVSSEEAVARELSNLESLASGTEAALADWDPLIVMNWNFLSRGLEVCGLALCGTREPGTDNMPENDGHFCPLCCVRDIFDMHKTKLCDEPKCTVRIAPGAQPWDEEWIDKCGDSLFIYAVEQGLVRRQ